MDVQEAAQSGSDRSSISRNDAPYLAPMPYRGKRNEPGYTRYVVEKKIAELGRQMSFEEVAKQNVYQC